MAQQEEVVQNKDNKKNTVECMGCGREIDKHHTGIKCINSCNICPECSKNFVNVVFEEPQKNIPLKCVLCRQEIIVETFERQLTIQQNQLFLLYHMKFSPKFLDKNEIIASCPFCEYWEINTVNEGRLLFYCQANGCKKTSCFWCKLQIRNKYNVNIEEKIDIDSESLEEHFECAHLAKYKQIWDKALSEGNTKSCPKCRVSGRKNNACTHMTCIKCQCQWCYVCGLSLKEQDKDNQYDDDNLFAHNVDWKINAKRCPMWLNEIKQIDNEWPEDSNDCVTFLHRIRTMRLLQAAVREIGNQNYIALCNKYNIQKTCGFDMNEVMNGQHILIKRNKNEDGIGYIQQNQYIAQGFDYNDLNFDHENENEPPPAQSGLCQDCLIL